MDREFPANRSTDEIGFSLHPKVACNQQQGILPGWMTSLELMRQKSFVGRV
jgi:hypothetical protein